MCVSVPFYGYLVKDGLRKSESLYSWFKEKYSLNAEMSQNHQGGTQDRSWENTYSWLLALGPLGEFGYHSDLGVPFRRCPFVRPMIGAWRM